MLAYYAFPNWYEFGERGWNDILTGENRRTLRKTCPSATLSNTNPIWIDPGANPGFRGERPATNDLSHGTALALCTAPTDNTTWCQDDTTNSECYFQTLFCIRLFYIYNCINTSPSLTIFIQLKINQRHMAQVVSRRPITAEVQVRVQVSPYGIWGGQHGTETDYCPSCSVFSCLCYTTVILHAHISPGGWTIGPLVAAVQRRYFIPSTWMKISQSNIFRSMWSSSGFVASSLSLLLIPIVKIGLQQFSWTTDTWDIR
jgi:hypothetical protein